MVMDPNRGRDPRTWRRAVDPSEQRVGFDVRVVLYEARLESIVVDCVAADPRRLILGDHQLESGEPLSIEVGLPDDGWLTASLLTLEDWAEDSRAVDVELRLRPSGHRARFSDGAATVMFDLLAVMGRMPRR